MISPGRIRDLLSLVRFTIVPWGEPRSNRTTSFADATLIMACVLMADGTTM